MSRLKKFFLYLINLPFYYVFKCVPKKTNLWVFGSWFGQKYSDSPKYLFEYVCKNHPEIQAIWLTNDSSTLQLIRKEGYRAVKAYSVLGYLVSARAKLGFISTSTADLNFYVLPHKVINLWHGIPLKKIMFDDKYNNSYPLKKTNPFKRIFAPYIDSNPYSVVVASSVREKEILISAFRLKQEEV
ncbi:MAG: CDP-glycerol glycerophosphotransferase family protein, partial [Sphingobacterium siyangense]